MYTIKQLYPNLKKKKKQALKKEPIWGFPGTSDGKKKKKKKNLPAVWETWDWFLGQKDLLKKGMATQSNILAWTIPWTEKPGKLQSMGSQRVRHNWVTNSFTCFHNQYKEIEQIFIA